MKTAFDIGLRLALACVLSWYLVFFCEHVTHYLMHAPWAARLPLFSRLRAVHMGHHERYRPTRLVQDGPYRSDGGTWLLLTNLPLLAFLGWALPLDLFVMVVVQSALFLSASNHLHSQFHVAGSWLERFAWFQRRRRYHFDHHHHPHTNMSLGGLELLFDRVHGTGRPR